MDEAMLTRDVIFNIHNTHTWAENPQNTIKFLECFL